MVTRRIDFSQLEGLSDEQFRERLKQESAAARMMPDSVSETIRAQRERIEAINEAASRAQTLRLHKEAERVAREQELLELRRAREERDAQKAIDDAKQGRSDTRRTRVAMVFAFVGATSGVVATLHAYGVL